MRNHQTLKISEIFNIIHITFTKSLYTLWSESKESWLVTIYVQQKYKETIISKESLQAPLLDKKLSWQRGSLFFQGETLEQAMLEIARYTDQHLVIIDASIRDTRVGGRFKTDDINGLLQSLVKSLNIKMEEGEGSQLLFSAK